MDGWTITTDTIFQKLLEIQQGQHRIQQDQHKIQQDNTEILKSIKTLTRDVSELNLKTENIKIRIDDLPDNMSQASSHSEHVSNFIQNTNTSNFNSTVKHRRPRKKSPRDMSTGSTESLNSVDDQDNHHQVVTESIPDKSQNSSGIDHEIRNLHLAVHGPSPTHAHTGPPQNQITNSTFTPICTTPSRTISQISGDSQTDLKRFDAGTPVVQCSDTETEESPAVLPSGKGHCSTSLRGNKALANELRLQTEIPADTRHQLNPSDISPGTQPMPSYTVDIPQAVNYTTIKVDFSSANLFLKSVSIDVNQENISALEPVFSSPAQEETVDGMYTILLVETSNLTNKLAIKQQISNYIENFTAETDDSAASVNLEENISLVTFGETPTIVKPFTIDYAELGQCAKSFIDDIKFEGQPNLYHALALCLAYINKKGSVSHAESLTILPRIILLTCGDIDDNHTAAASNSVQMKAKIKEFMPLLSKYNINICCVGIGEFENHRPILEEISNGRLYPDSAARMMGKYYRHQDIAGHIQKSLEEKGTNATFNECYDAGGYEGDSSDRQEVARILGITVEVAEEIDPDEFQFDECNLGTQFNHLPTLGSRVQRGTSWQYNDQDGNGPGTVIAHQKEGAILVFWDVTNDANLYSYSSNRQDVAVINKPRIMGNPQQIDIGCWVKRGRHWSRGDEDGNAHHGVVVRISNDHLTVKVRWPVGLIDTYKYGKDQQYELAIVIEPEPIEDVSAPSEATPSNAASNEMVTVWQFQDSGNQWRPLFEEESDKLEVQHSQGPGTVMVHSKIGQLRVDTHAKQYASSGQKGKVRRITISRGEFEEMLGLEQFQD